MESKEKIKKTKKKLLNLESGELGRSLHEHTGEFYECHCMKLTISSDTESCSDTTKTYYCNFCGNGYQTVAELAEHEKLHQIQCRICSQFLNVQSYRDHFQQHILRVYACYICGFECICKEVLTRHLDYHFEQQTFDNILNMEQEYNVYPYSKSYFSPENFHSNMNNLLFFLTYPHDHQYARNLIRKVACHVCFQEVSVFEYELHLKVAHLLDWLCLKVEKIYYTALFFFFETVLFMWFSCKRSSSSVDWLYVKVMKRDLISVMLK